LTPFSPFLFDNTRSIDGFRAIAKPPGVFHATAVLSRVSKKEGFIAWLKKKSRKRRPKNN